MSYDYFARQDEENEAGGAQPSSSTSPIITGTEPSKGVGGTGSSSGQFVNLQSYIDANKGSGFSDRVVNEAAGRVNKADEAINKSESAFKGQVDRSIIRPDETLFSEIRREPRAVANDPNKFSKFTQLRDASYGGPGRFVDSSEYSDAQRQTSEAKKLGEDLSTDYGQKAFIGDLVTKNPTNPRYDYTAGQRALDQYIVANDPTSRSRFEQLSSKAATLQPKFQDLSSQLDAYAKQAQAQTAQARSSARRSVGVDDAGNLLPYDTTRGNAGAIQDAVEALDAFAEKRRQELRAAAPVLQQSYGKSNISEVSPETMALLGLNAADFAGVDLSGLAANDSGRYYLDGDRTSWVTRPEAGMRADAGLFYGIDPRRYIDTANETDINRGSVANAEQQAQLLALQRLAGLSTPLIANPSEVGRYASSPLFGVRASDFTNDVAARRQSLTRDLQDLKNTWAAQAQGDPNALWAMDRRLEEVNAIRRNYGLPEISGAGSAPKAAPIASVDPGQVIGTQDPGRVTADWTGDKKRIPKGTRF